MANGQLERMIDEAAWLTYGIAPVRLGAPSFTTRIAFWLFWLASSCLHLCEMNCFWTWACASLGRPIVSGSAANSALQYSHTPSTEISFSRLTILNLRFAMPKFPRERTRFAILWKFKLHNCRSSK